MKQSQIKISHPTNSSQQERIMKQDIQSSRRELFKTDMKKDKHFFIQRYSQAKISSDLAQQKWKINLSFSQKKAIRLPCLKTKSKSKSKSKSKIKTLQNQYELSTNPQTKKKRQLFLTYASQSSPKKDQINQTINKSNRMIELIKQSYETKTLQKQFRQESLRTRFRTDNSQAYDPNNYIYSYLKRKKVVNPIDAELNTKEVRKFFKSDAYESEHRIISQKSREYLLNKIDNNDYKSYKQVQKYKSQLAKQSIRQDMQKKKVKFDQDYKTRNNVPYFWFLGLSDLQKKRVLKNQKQMYKIRKYENSKRSFRKIEQ